MASKVLALNTRRLQADWQVVYGHPVVLAETFVDPSRFAGTSYRAAGWQYLGDSRGFARHHHRYAHHGRPKGLWVRPLGPESPAVLRAPFLAPALTEGAVTLLDFKALNWSGPDGLRERLAGGLTDPRQRPGNPARGRPSPGPRLSGGRRRTAHLCGDQRLDARSRSRTTSGLRRPALGIDVPSAE